MMFITGPLYSGKRTFARNFRGSVIADVQDAAAETQTRSSSKRWPGSWRNMILSSPPRSRRCCPDGC